MKVLANKLGLSFLSEPWFLQIIVLLFAAAIISAASHYLLRKAEKIALLTTSPWDDAIISAAKRPIHISIWLVCISYAGVIASRETHAVFLGDISSVRDVGLIICLSWFLMRLIRNTSNNIITSHKIEGEELDTTTIDALSKLLRLTVFIVTSLVAMQTLGFSVSGLLAAGGIGGLAVGFAAKDLLANFFGGLTIYLDRPFVVGDWIRSPDKSIEGTVEYISWRHTRVRAFNKNPIYVPNALFTNIVVENPSRMTHRRIKETIGIRYGDIGAMSSIVADVRTMLQQHESIDATQTLIVSFDTFGPSSIDFFIYTFTQTTDWIQYHAIKQDVLLQIAAIIDKHHAQIAFPTRTLIIDTPDVISASPFKPA